MLSCIVTEANLGSKNETHGSVIYLVSFCFEPYGKIINQLRDLSSYWQSLVSPQKYSASSSG